MAKKGGYQMVNLATLTYALALTYVECGKPLLIYDGVNKPYYADSIEKVGDNVVIRKSGQTIVVDENDNVVNGIVASDVTTKKIYCHPITIDDDVSVNKVHIALLIFDNSNEEYNTIDKLSNKLNTIFNINPSAIFPISGGMYYDSTSSLHIAQKIRYDGNDIVINTLRPNGEQGYFVLSTYASSATIYDGVNAIN